MIIRADFFLSILGYTNTKLLCFVELLVRFFFWLFYYYHHMGVDIDELVELSGKKERIKISEINCFD